MLSLSPRRMILLGLARAPLTATLPPVTAAAARERVLKKRAAQSHLSMRIGSLVSSISSSFTLRVIVCVLALRPIKVGHVALLQQLVIREIDLKGSDGDVALVHRHAISALLLIKSQVIAADPVIFFAAGVHAFHDVFAIVPFALPGEAPAFDLILQQWRNVDIQQRFEGHASFMDARNQSCRKFGRRLELEIFKCHQGYCNGGNTEKGSFDGSGNRT